MKKQYSTNFTAAIRSGAFSSRLLAPNVIIVAVSLLCAAGYAKAAGPLPPSVSFSFVVVDPPGSSRTAANGASPTAIVGEYDAGGTTHGFVRKGSRYTTFDRPGAVATILAGANPADQRAGFSVDGGGVPHAFIWNNGTFTTLDPSGSTSSLGFGINGPGTVVGRYKTADQKNHGFTWRKGVYRTLNVPNDHPTLGTVAIGVNDFGQVVGTYVDNTAQANRHGFLLTGSVYKTIDFPGAKLTVLQSINNGGVIAGLYHDGADAEHGFLLCKGVYMTIEPPNARNNGIYSINDLGTIAGYYTDLSGVDHGYAGRSWGFCNQ